MAYFIGKTEDGKDIYGTDFDIEVKSTKQAEDGKRTVSLLGSTPSIDRDGDTINQSGWDVAAFRKNPVNLWAHNHDIPAIARTNKFKKTKDALDFQEIEFPPEGIHPFADMIYSLMANKFIRMGSVGFIPIKHEKRDMKEGEDGNFWSPTNFIKQELLEFSIVNVGSNRDALAYQHLKDKGFATDKVNKLFEAMQERRVIPFKHYPLDDEDAAWSGPKETAAAEVDDLKRMSTYVDTEQDDVKAGYKLPHHRADGFNTVWRGVAAAMAALFGARGGVDIPDNERKGVFDHLKKHYEEFDKDVPEFKEYNEAELKDIFPDDVAEKDMFDVFDIDRQCKCIECGKDIDAGLGEKFVHDGKCPLCEDCFDKAKGDKDITMLLDGDGVPPKQGKVEDTGGAVVLNTGGEIMLDETMKASVALEIYGAETVKAEEILCGKCGNPIFKENKSLVIKVGDEFVCDECGKKDLAEKVDAIVGNEEKAGAVLSRANKNKLKQSIELIGAVLASAEPAEEDGKDVTDTKLPPPKDVKLSVNDKLDMLIKAIASIGESKSEESSTDIIDIEETKAPEINLEEMELPPTPEKVKDEVDMEMLSKALKEMGRCNLEKLDSSIKREIRKATGVIE